MSTTGALDNDGQIRVDGRGDGGSSLTVGGTLTNSGTLDIGYIQLAAPVKMTVTSLDNTGAIGLIGSSANQALLDVSGGAGFGTAGVLSGAVGLLANCAIEFASGEITSLAASAQLDLNGSHALIEDSTALGSNSALTGLASIGAWAYFMLENKAAVSTTGSLVNDGTIDLAAGSLTVAGTLTNTNVVETGGGDSSVSGSITAESLVNSGMVLLSGDGTTVAALNVSGATTNNFSIRISADAADLAGAVGGAGSFTLAYRPVRPSTTTTISARTRSSSSRRSPSAGRLAVSAPATRSTRSTRRTLPCPKRRSILSRIQAVRAGRSRSMTGGWPPIS